MPTFLAMAGARVPDGHQLDGVNLLPVILEGKTLGDRQLFWNGRAMREGPWKLIIAGRGAEGIGLYNLASDLGEQENLASRYPERVEKMRTAIEAWKQDVAAGATPQRRRAGVTVRGSRGNKPRMNAGKR